LQQQQLMTPVNQQLQQQQLITPVNQQLQQQQLMTPVNQQLQQQQLMPVNQQQQQLITPVNQPDGSIFNLVEQSSVFKRLGAPPKAPRQQQQQRTHLFTTHHVSDTRELGSKALVSPEVNHKPIGRRVEIIDEMGVEEDSIPANNRGHHTGVKKRLTDGWCMDCERVIFRRFNNTCPYCGEYCPPPSDS
jgi:hypothetical protein